MFYTGDISYLMLWLFQNNRNNNSNNDSNNDNTNNNKITTKRYNK